MFSEREFADLCNQKVKAIKDRSKNKRVWIYGAGVGASILKKILMENDIEIYGFIDIKWKELKQFKGHPVKWINECDVNNDFLLEEELMVINH